MDQYALMDPLWRAISIRLINYQDFKGSIRLATEIKRDGSLWAAKVSIEVGRRGDCEFMFSMTHGQTAEEAQELAWAEVLWNIKRLRYHQESMPYEVYEALVSCARDAWNERKELFKVPDEVKALYREAFICDTTPNVVNPSDLFLFQSLLNKGSAREDDENDEAVRGLPIQDE